MEAINITKCVEVIDNWGNTETYKGADLYKLLITPEDWTDDQTFISDKGNIHLEVYITKRIHLKLNTLK